jgi:hypothetical protein
MLWEKDVVKLFKKYKPIEPEDIKPYLEGIKMRKIGSGAFRNVYRIGTLEIVAKFPKNKYSDFDYEDNVNHAMHELKIINKIKKDKRYLALKPFIPTVYYANETNGVMVVEYCPALRGSVVASAVQGILGSLFEILFKKDAGTDMDIHEYNVGRNRDDQFKVIDLGLI